MNSSLPAVTILGGGAWGSTLADLLARKSAPVTIWERSPEARQRLTAERHPFGIPELRLPDSINIEESLESAVSSAEIIVVAIASQAIGDVARTLNKILQSTGARPLIVLASKGIDIATLSPLASVVQQAIPDARVGVLSGPCIAIEVARGIPTSAVAASEDGEAAALMQSLFSTERLRIYTSDDVIGVELGGALKNIIAIAAGISDGLGFGANSKAALMTRGLAEITRLAKCMGARDTTLFGLSGLGDLAVTCFSPHSRNRTFGEHLGKGKTPDQARKAIGMTVEGEPTAHAALKLAEGYQIELPVTQAVVNVCNGTWTASDAVKRLMTRDLKVEA